MNPKGRKARKLRVANPKADDEQWEDRHGQETNHLKVRHGLNGERD